MASELYASGKEQPQIYWDRKFFATLDDQIAALGNATTLYVGNLSFHTTEAQITELFSIAGHVKRVIMGLNKATGKPCGFCFVEYDDHESAIRCRDYISHTKLDDREIRCEIDSGFIEGRQYGRGASGGQVRDERRTDLDHGRGGWGAQQVQVSDFPERYTEAAKADEEMDGGSADVEPTTDSVEVKDEKMEGE